MEATIKFTKLHSDAIIPNKRVEDMGLDLYACFDEEFRVIAPHETALIPTGLAYAISNDYGLIVKERGSTGSKGMAIRMGVLDSGYRGEIILGITNTTEEVIVISKLEKQEIKNKLGQAMGLLPFRHYIHDDAYVVYPYQKALAQAIVVPVPKLQIEEVSYNDLCRITSERGTGAFGSSHK